VRDRYSRSLPLWIGGPENHRGLGAAAVRDTFLASLRPLNSRDLVFLSGFALVAMAGAFVVTEQLSSTPIFAGKLVSSIWKETSIIIGQDLVGVISMARNQPYFSAGAKLACMLSIACGFLAGRNSRAAHLLMMAFAGSALIYSIWHSRIHFLAELFALACSVLDWPTCRSSFPSRLFAANSRIFARDLSPFRHGTCSVGISKVGALT
jgi:hypothetical protein